MYRLITDNGIESITSVSYLKQTEAVLRGLRKNYTIEYPDGYRVHCEAM